MSNDEYTEEIENPQDPQQDLGQDLRQESVEERPRQQVSVPHLVMALVFLGIAGSWALHAAGVIESVEVQWLVPAILVVAGAAGLLVSLTRAGKGFARPRSGA